MRAKQGIVVVVFDENVVATQPAQHILAQEAGDLLRTIVPAQDFPVQIQRKDSGLDPIHDRLKDIRTGDSQHGRLQYPYRRIRTAASVPSLQGPLTCTAPTAQMVLLLLPIQTFTNLC
jgi:hypothetical protein